MASKTLPPSTPTRVAPTSLLPIQRPEEDVPHTFFIDYSGKRLQIDWPAVCKGYPGGVFELPLDPVTKASFLDITQFRRISLMISSSAKSSATLHIGKWSPATFCEAHAIPADDRIHSFEVTGPQMNLSFSGGTALGVEQFQMWIYLRS